MKAYALVAREIPVFRQMYFRWPLANIYEHPHSVFMLAIAREFRAERWLFWGRFSAPESRSLADLQKQLEGYTRGDVKSVFKKQYQLSGLPSPLRRLVWNWNLNTSGRVRARRTGTAFLSTLAGRGAEIGLPPSLHTGNLTYGPMDEAGRSRITIAYDHRLMDGAIVAEFLERLEATLCGAVADELVRANPRAVA